MRHEADREYGQDPQDRADTADLSERITAEIEKLASSSAMGETDKPPIALLLERTECISGECPFSLIVTDMRGQIVFCNERTLQLFGYTIGEMIQKRFHDLSDPRLRKIPQRILGHMNDGLTPKFSGHLVLRGKLSAMPGQHPALARKG
jgi:PAS domain-containing protein